VDPRVPTQSAEGQQQFPMERGRLESRASDLKTQWLYNLPAQGAILSKSSNSSRSGSGVHGEVRMVMSLTEFDECSLESEEHPICAYTWV
jgi:hypothetical protein